MKNTFKKRILLILLIILLIVGIAIYFCFKIKTKNNDNFNLKNGYIVYILQIDDSNKSIYVGSKVDLYVEYDNKYGMLANNVEVLSINDSNGNKISSTNTEDATYIFLAVKEDIKNTLMEIEHLKEFNIKPILNIKKYNASNSQEEVDKETLIKYINEKVKVYE